MAQKISKSDYLVVLSQLVHHRIMSGYSNKPYIIGITGGSGSGKTTFIKELRKRFPEKELCILSQDDYYKPRELQMPDPKGIRNFDLPDSIDSIRLEKDVMRLCKGEVVRKEEYTFNNPRKTPRILEFTPAPTLVLEGLFVFYIESIFNKLDLKVFIHAKENLKVIRRIKRDQIERNYPLEDVLYRYQHHVLPAYEKHIYPFMEKSDIVINNNESFDRGLEVLEGFIHTKVRETTVKPGKEKVEF
ncbi:MAG: uridine kinase [Saprospirales bacterium]|nr:MAG: uridine kinase [Saprospirales bacterium]